MKIVFTKSVKISKLRRVVTLIVLISVTLFIIAYALEYQTIAKYKPICVFRHATGLYCPGCGSSLTLHSLLQGNFYQAFRYNMFVFIAIPFLLYFYIANWIEVIIGRSLPRFVFSKRLILLIVALILLFTVFRNIPYAPFNNLAPTKVSSVK